MPMYHFQLRTGEKITEDEEGSNLPDLAAARRFALDAARELLAESILCEIASPDCIMILDGAGHDIATVFVAEIVPENIRHWIQGTVTRH